MTTTTGRPKGKPRNTAACIGLTIVTLGVYALYWTYITHSEIKDYSGLGVGGVLGLVIYVFVAPVTFFLIPHAVNGMLAQHGRTSRVSALTGLWVLLPLLGPIVWFVKVQGQLNEFWPTAP